MACPYFSSASGSSQIRSLPYRRLTRLEANPYQLRVNGLESIGLEKKGTTLWTIPLNQIEQWSFVEKGPWMICTFKSKKEIFLPYFTRRSYDELMHWLSAS